eukprot:6195528-Pleurochrysis_carterae.AAC.1
MAERCSCMRIAHQHAFENSVCTRPVSKKLLRKIAAYDSTHTPLRDAVAPVDATHLKHRPGHAKMKDPSTVPNTKAYVNFIIFPNCSKPAAADPFVKNGNSEIMRTTMACSTRNAWSSALRCRLPNGLACGNVGAETGDGCTVSCQIFSTSSKIGYPMPKGRNC